MTKSPNEWAVEVGEILMPDDDCFKVPGKHCGSCLSDFEDSGYSDMKCCDHAKWLETATQQILKVLDRAMVGAVVKELEVIDKITDKLDDDYGEFEALDDIEAHIATRLKELRTHKGGSNERA